VSTDHACDPTCGAFVPKHPAPNDGGKNADFQIGLRMRIRRSLDGLQRRFNESWEDDMTSDVGQALLMIGGISCLIVLAIWAFWFLERFRGGNATRPGAQRR
jgi:hypothetical protein